jgi:hypothetical protein
LENTSEFKAKPATPSFDMLQVENHRRWIFMKISTEGKDKVIEAIKNESIDATDISYPNLIDKIILRMKRVGA